jgi:hypothetical protein
MPAVTLGSDAGAGGGFWVWASRAKQIAKAAKQNGVRMGTS